MIENRAEQVEALQAMLDYNPRLVKAMKAVSDELAGERQPDTDEYLLSVIKGINWEIQVLNGTMEVLNEKELQVEKDAVNDIFVEFNDLYQNKNDSGMAVSFQTKVIPFFETFEVAARNVIS